MNGPDLGHGHVRVPGLRQGQQRESGRAFHRFEPGFQEIAAGLRVRPLLLRCLEFVSQPRHFLPQDVAFAQEFRHFGVGRCQLAGALALGGERRLYLVQPNFQVGDAVLAVQQSVAQDVAADAGAA